VNEIVTATNDEHRRASLDELLAKLQRKKRFVAWRSCCWRSSRASSCGREAGSGRGGPVR
jgi:hypothetical protein